MKWQRQLRNWGPSTGLAILEALIAILLAGWGGAWIGAGHGTAALIGLVVAPWSLMGDGWWLWAALPYWACIGFGLVAPTLPWRLVSVVLLGIHWVSVVVLLHGDADRGRGFFWLLRDHADRDLLAWIAAFSTWELWRFAVAALNLWPRRRPRQDGVATEERHPFSKRAFGVVAIEAVFLVIVCWMNRGWVFKGVFASPASP